MITEAFVAGLTQENAQRLIERAKELGLPVSVIKTTDGGFIVPAVVAEDSPATPPTPPEPEDDEEDEDDGEDVVDGEIVPRETTPALDAPKKRLPRRKPTKTEPEAEPEPVKSTDDQAADAVASEE